MCTPSQVSFSPLVSNNGYQKKAIFPNSAVKTVISLLSYEFFTFRVSFSPIFSKAGYHFEGEILKLAKKLFLEGHTSVQLKIK